MGMSQMTSCQPARRKRDAATALEVAAETNKSKPMFVPIFICINELKGLQYMIFAPYDMLQFKRIKSTYLSWINSFPHLGLCNHLWIIAGIAFLFTLVILRQRWLAKNATCWNDNVQELEKDGSDKGQQELRTTGHFPGIYDLRFI